MRALLALASLAALAACGGSDTTVDAGDGDAMATEDVVAAAGDLARPQAGEYRQTAEVVEFSLPGMGEQESGMMRDMMASSATAPRTYCITEEQAEQGFEEALRRGQEGDASCSFTRFDTSGDTIDAVMTCNPATGQQMTMQMAGTVTETTQDMTVTMETSNPMPGGSGQMRMVLHSTAERIGDCPA